MTFNELRKEYTQMCNEQEHCNKCKYNGNFHCQLAFGYDKALEDVKHQMILFHTDMKNQYGADIIEARCDAFDYLSEWIKEQHLNE